MMKPYVSFLLQSPIDESLFLDVGLLIQMDHLTTGENWSNIATPCFRFPYFVLFLPSRLSSISADDGNDDLDVDEVDTEDRDCDV